MSACPCCGARNGNACAECDRPSNTPPPAVTREIERLSALMWHRPTLVEVDSTTLLWLLNKWTAKP